MKVKEPLLLGCVAAIGIAAGALADGRPGEKSPAKPAIAAAEQPTAAVTTAAWASDLPVVGYLEKRGQTITIKAGPKGPVYSARTAEGKALFENLSAEQLRVQAPELHQFIKTAVGSHSGRSGVVVDASVRSVSPSQRKR